MQHIAIRNCGLLLAGFLFLVLAACSSPQEKEAQHLARGIELYEEGDDAKAMIEFRNALRLNPKNADVLYYVGLIHERAERIPQAYAAFQAAAAERPGFKDANMKLGMLGLLSNNLEASSKAAKAILEAHPDDPEGLTLDAAVMLRQADLQRAQDTAEIVLAKNPDHENALAVVIGVSMARGRPEEAERLLEESLARLPQSAPLWLLKIALLQKEDDAEGVIEAYQRLFAIEPENARYRLALANFHRARDDSGRAEAVLRDAIDAGIGTSEMGRALASLVYQEKGLAAAEAEIGQLLAREPEAHPLRFLLADFYAREKRMADAERALQEVIDQAQEDAETQDAKAALARLKFIQDDNAAAEKLVAEVIEENAEHRNAHLVQGLIDLEEGRYDEAVRSGRTALRRDPLWLPGLKLVAEGHLRNNEKDLAVNTLNQIVALDPDDGTSAEALATLLTQSGNLDAALKIWDQIIRTAENPLRALEARAQIQIQQRNWTAAQSDIERLLETKETAASGAWLAGNLLIAQNRFEQGREWFDKALAIKPDATQAVVSVVRSYVAESDVDGALDYLARRTSERPEDALAYNMMGELLVRQDRLTDAENAFRKAIAMKSDWLVPYRGLAKALRDAGRIDEAVALHKEALEVAPDNPDLLMDLAATELAGRRFEDAIDSFARVLALQPENDVAANNYAALVADYSHEDDKVLDEALKTAQRFRTSDNPWFLDTLGWIHYRRGDFPVAASFLDRAVSHRPEESQFRYHLGMALFHSGQKERARMELSKAIEGDASYPGVEEARTALAALDAEAAVEPASSRSGG